MFIASDADGTGRKRMCTVRILTGIGAIKENTGRVKKNERLHYLDLFI